MKNTVNNFRNLGQHLRLHMGFTAMFYLWAFIGIGLSIIIAAYLTASPDYPALHGFLNNGFWTYINITGFVFASSAFFMYGKKNAKMHLLTLPVSPLNRLLTAFIYMIPGFWIVFFLFYYGLANLIIKVFVSFELTQPFVFEPFAFKNIKSNLDILTVLWKILTFQSIMFMIGSFFPKLGFLKTVLVLIVAIIIFNITDYITASYSFDTNTVVPLLNISLLNPITNNSLLTEIPITNIIWNCISALLVPFSYYIAYLRIKEMEA